MHAGDEILSFHLVKPDESRRVLADIEAQLKVPSCKPTISEMAFWTLGTAMHVVVENGRADLIAAMIQRGCNPFEYDCVGNDSFDRAFESKLPDRTKIDTIKELLRVVSKEDYNKLSERLQALLAEKTEQRSADVEKLKNTLDPQWRTKTWRSQIMAFLMANHPRAGAQATARLYEPCLFRHTASFVPTYMSFQERLARRERKKQAAKMSCLPK